MHRTNNTEVVDTEISLVFTVDYISEYILSQIIANRI